MARRRGVRHDTALFLDAVMRAILAVCGLVAFVASAAAQERLGVVLMHGKGGLPRQLIGYDRALAESDALVARPEMCWSRARIYDRAYLDCMRDVDTAIEALKAQGATAIVIGGMSLGGNMALGYGARHGGLRGVIALAPAHPPEILARRPAIAASLKTANEMLAQGRGDERTTFDDINTGRSFTVETTPRIYLSFFGPQSPAMLPVNASRLTAPLLLVAGTEDRTQRGRGYVFDRAPANPRNSYVTVKADHRGTPAAALEAVRAWLKELQKS